MRSWVRQMEWVLRNLSTAGKDLVKRKPSAAAYEVWKVAREDPKWFIERFVVEWVKREMDREQREKEREIEQRQEQDLGPLMERMARIWRERDTGRDGKGGAEAERGGS